MHQYAFDIVSLTWLAYFLSHDYFSYKEFTVFFIYFLFPSDEGPTLETLDLLSVSPVYQPLYSPICISEVYSVQIPMKFNVVVVAYRARYQWQSNYCGNCRNKRREKSSSRRGKLFCKIDFFFQNGGRLNILLCAW